MSPSSLFLFLLSLISIQTVAQEIIDTDTVEQRSINPDNQREFSAIKNGEIKQLLFDADEVYFSSPDSTINLANKIIERSAQIEFTEGEIITLNIAGEMYHYRGDYPQSLDAHFRACYVEIAMSDQVILNFVKVYFV